MATLGDLIVRVGANIEDFRKGMGEVNSQLKQVMREADQATAGFDRLGGKLQSMGGELMRLGAGMTAAITVPLVGIGAAALKVAGNMEQAKVAFTNMLGSAERAEVFIKRLQEFSLHTPFEFQNLVSASQRLMAMGFQAKQVLPVMTAIGDAVAAVGGNAQVLDRVVLALGQIQAKGKLSAEEMRQLTEAGIPAWDMLAKKLNTDVASAMKMVENRAVDSGTAVAAFTEGVTKRFGGMMEQQSKTLAGMWSNIKDKITATLAEIGAVLAPTAKGLMGMVDPLLGFATTLAKAFAALPTPIQGAVVAFTALAAAAGPMLMVFGSITSGAGSLIKVLPYLSMGFTGLTGALSGLMGALPAASSALASFVGQIPAAVAAFGAWSRAGFAEIGRALVAFATVQIPAAASALTSFATTAVAGASASIKAFATTTIPALLSSIQNLGTASLSGLSTAFVNFGATLKGVAASAIPAMITGLAALAAAAAVAAGAFALYKLGEAGYEYIKANREASEAEAGRVATLKKLSASLAENGVVIERGNKSLDQWQAELMKAAEGMGKVKAVVVDTGDALKKAFTDLGIKPVVQQREELAKLKADYELIKKTFQEGGLFNGQKLQLQDVTNAWNAYAKAAGTAVDAVKAAFEKLGITGVNELTKQYNAAVDAYDLLVKRYNAGDTRVFQSDITRAGAAVEELGQKLEALRGEVQSLSTFKDPLEWLNSDRHKANIFNSIIEGSEALRLELDKLTLSSESVMDRINQLQAIFPRPAGAADELSQSLKNLRDNLDKLGVKDTSSRVEEMGNALQGLADVQGNLRVTSDEYLIAWKNYIEELIKSGQKLSPEMMKQYEIVKQSYGGQIKETENAMRKVAQEVSTILTDMSRGITDAIFQAKSLGDVFTQVAQDIAKAIVRNIIEGALSPLIKKISETILSFGGLGKAISGVFGGASGAAGSAAGAAAGAAGKTAGGAAGSAAGGLTGVGSLMGTIGAVGAAVGAISGIIGNFQSAKMETTLNAIEESTRYLKIVVCEGADSLYLNVRLMRQDIAQFLSVFSNNTVPDLKQIFNMVKNGPAAGSSGTIDYTLQLANIFNAIGRLQIAVETKANDLYKLLSTGTSVVVSPFDKSGSASALSPEASAIDTLRLELMPPVSNIDTMIGKFALDLIPRIDGFKSAMESKWDGLMGKWGDMMKALGALAPTKTNPTTPSSTPTNKTQPITIDARGSTFLNDRDIDRFGEMLVGRLRTAGVH